MTGSADARVAAGASTRWRLLLVEDSADDAELACLELADAGIDVECRRVEAEPALLQALQSFAPHLVLSDLNLPGFCGWHALELVRRHAPGARFAFLSGDPTQHASPPEGEPAPDAWLSKDDMTRLPALVRRLLAG